MPSFCGGDYIHWLCPPVEWCGLLIMVFDEDIDGLLQRPNRVEDAAFQAAFCELGEEPLDRLQPGAGRRDDMKRPAGMARQPCPNLVMLAGGIVVEDDVVHLAGRALAFNGIEKADELLVTVLCRHLPITVPSRMLSAANSVVVPFRL